MKITKQVPFPARKGHTGRIIVDQYEQIKLDRDRDRDRQRQREQQTICQFCRNQIPSRLMASHRNVCAFGNGNLCDGYFRSEEAESRSQGKMGASTYTQKNILNRYQEESPSRLASQRNIIRVNHSALSQKSQKSQKKTKNIKINNLENGSVRNLSRNKNQKQSNIKPSSSKNKNSKSKHCERDRKMLFDHKKISNPNVEKFQKKNNPNTNTNMNINMNRSMQSQEYRQYFGDLNKKKGLSKIKKDVKNVWMQHSNKKQNKYKQVQNKREVEKQLRQQKLKRLQNQTEKLKKQQEQLIKQLQKQKRQQRLQQRRRKARNNSQIKRQQPRAPPRQQSGQHQNRNSRNRPAQPRPQHQHQQRRNMNRYPTVQQSYYEQIPVNHPHRTLNFISQTINQQFEMMKEQFQHMNQFFSNFAPFSSNGIVYFERDQSEDYSIDSSGDSVGYEGQQEQMGLYDEQIQLLPKYPYVKRLGGDDQCAICISGIKHQEMVRTLPCHHIFHDQCIDQWLKRRAACPVCRDQIGDLGQ